MWRRFRRKSMAPRRPAVFPEQIGLVILIAVAMAVGIYFVVRVALA
jgi:hypothetical protein